MLEEKDMIMYKKKDIIHPSGIDLIIDLSHKKLKYLHLLIFQVLRHMVHRLI